MAGQMRSPNYPAVGLPDAVRHIQQVWDKEKRTPLDMATLAKAMGYQSLSGPARTRVAALGKYGLIEKVGGNYRLSDLAVNILHGEPQQKKDALTAAASRPEMFRELYASHAEASDDSLKSFLITRKQFSEAGAKGFIKSFRDTMSLAKPEGAGYSSQNGEDESEDMQTETTNRREASSFQMPGGNVSGPMRNQTVLDRGRVFTWPLSKGVNAEVRFNGGQVTEAHIDMLTKYLELAKAAIATEDETQEG